MDSCNYKTLDKTGKLHLDHVPIIKNSIGPGYDIRKTNPSSGGYGLLGKVYKNNGDACGNGKFLTILFKNIDFKN